MKVHIFGATSSLCCTAFALRRSVVDLGSQFEPFVSEIIERCFCVDELPPEERSKVLKLEEHGKEVTECQVRITWTVATNAFTFATTVLWKPKTKRGVLAIMNSVFDPLGFLTPVVLEAKLIFRSLCDIKSERDEDLLTDSLDRWEKWLASLNY